MGDLIESNRRNIPELSHRDEEIWSRMVEFLPQARNSSDVYTALHPVGQKGVVIGPWYLPYEAVALQLAVSMGESGKLYSADHQGGLRGLIQAKETVGLGDSNWLKEQLRQISALGVPMAQFEWLGKKSSLAHIPSWVKPLDLIADHETLKFVSSKASVEYLVKSVYEIVSSLRVGGFWIHHGDTSTFLDCIPTGTYGEESMDYWASRLGIRILRHKVEEDAYVIPVSQHAQDALRHSHDIPFLIPNTLPRDEEVVYDGAIHISEHKIKYPRRWVFVVQKI